MKKLTDFFNHKKNKQKSKSALENKAPAVGATPEGSINTYNREQWKHLLSTMGNPRENNFAFEEKLKDFDRELRTELKNKLVVPDNTIPELIDPENPNNPINDPIPTYIEARGYEFSEEPEPDPSELTNMKSAIWK